MRSIFIAHKFIGIIIHWLVIIIFNNSAQFISERLIFFSTTTSRYVSIPIQVFNLNTIYFQFIMEFIFTSDFYNVSVFIIFSISWQFIVNFMIVIYLKLNRAQMSNFGDDMLSSDNRNCNYFYKVAYVNLGAQDRSVPTPCEYCLPFKKILRHFPWQNSGARWYHRWVSGTVHGIS